MNQIIAIFSLNLVLFPSSLYPLHIFEERYKRLIKRCISNNEGFGIISKIDESISDIGCFAVIDRILKNYSSGSMDILVKGIERFKINNKWMHSDGYFEASVLPYNDYNENLDSSKIYTKTIDIFKNIINRTTLNLENSFWINLSRARDKSFKLAEKSGLKLKDQQKFLSLQSEKDRMKFLYNHLEKLESMLDKSEVLRDIIQSDGFFN